ncbi:YdiU domain protein [Myxozyma melibiosi]|uniref:Selenoprotein O n=1 Tax=Myxozyma melibiosi TaxID=54550 RepID=A0ABR1FEI0_9ASCO
MRLANCDRIITSFVYKQRSFKILSPARAQNRNLSTISKRMASSATKSYSGVTLAELPKSHVFTEKLPADPQVPTPEAAMDAKDPGVFLPRAVTDAAFTYVKPGTHNIEKAKLLAVSEAAMRDLGLKLEEKDTDEFKEVVIGNKIYEEHFPWAQVYGGYQFGEWAGQLGDGRAISIFEATNPATGVRYEVQLKGAGRTPFSRFADGMAVLRSSVREFLVSEALNALSIPTTRALSLTLFPNEGVRRETIEQRAIVARMAPTWIRFGNFDIHRRRGNRKLLKALADYSIDEVYGGLDKIKASDPKAYEGLSRYHIFYKEVARRTAETTALWQTYGFMNGVLNTDNISIFGLSLDFGPFAFMDTYNPMYTPNHDDHRLRYSYRNTPTIMWWNLVRLGEDLAELFAAESEEFVNSEQFIESGIPEDKLDAFVERAEKIIEGVGEYYKETLEAAHSKAFVKRLGLTSVKKDDSADGIVDSVLLLLKEQQLDFNHFFRKLGRVRLFPGDGEDESSLTTEEDIKKIFLTHDRGYSVPHIDDSAKIIHDWLFNEYKSRLVEEGNVNDSDRKSRMDKVNPNFILRTWIMDEAINRIQRHGDAKFLEHVLYLALHPFEDSWTSEEEDKDKYEAEMKFIGDVPRLKQALTCSCSS